MRTVKMGMRLIIVAAVILSVSGIKVPVDSTDEIRIPEKTAEHVQSPEKPNYYETKEDQVDSYLVPPNSQHALEGISDEIATLSTYLLPPSEDRQTEYYKPTEAGEQTDWYPIAPAISPSRQLLPPKQTENNPAFSEVSETEPIYVPFRTGKLTDASGRHTQVDIPSRDLQPPLENAPNDYESAVNNQFENARLARPAGFPFSAWKGPAISVPNNIRINAFGQIPQIPKKYKNPTKLYPKKYAGAFKSTQTQLNEQPFNEKKEPKPLKIYKLNENIDNEYRIPYEDKTILEFEEAQKKRISKRKPENVKVQELEASESNEDISSEEQATSPEQDASASNYREPLRRPYPAALRQAPRPAATNQAQSHAPPADGERTEFRMHGMKGPHSYQFGFDTGKGKNRQFRYEERDNDGHVKGHYGYMDKNGKLRVVNYDADPEHGFRAEPPVEAE